MLRLWLYITSLVKFLILMTIVAFITNYFFPKASLIVFGLGVIGSFGAAIDDSRERYKKALKRREQRRILKVAKKSKDEFEGFEQAIALTRRTMN